MACRVGITTRPNEGKREWQRRHPYLRNWQILQSNIKTKQEAQRLENYYAFNRKCTAHGGGSGPDNPFALWSVYYFEY